MGILKAIKGVFGGGGASTLIDGTNGLLKAVDQLSTSAEEKATIRADIIKTVVSAQSSVLVAEANSESWLARSWRPLLATQWGLIVTYSFFIGPMFGLPVVVIPPAVFNLLSLMIGGYVGSRSVEKLAKVAVPVMTGRQALKLAKMGVKSKG